MPDVINDDSNLSMSPEREDEVFFEDLVYFSRKAHARSACNGWGGQPIPDRTDLFNGTKNFFLSLFSK